MSVIPLPKTPSASSNGAASSAPATTNAAAASSGSSLNWLQVLQELFSKATDPSVIAALGPQSGLQVTPVLFQSIEQEGRWKPSALLAKSCAASRTFELQQQVASKSKGTTLAEPYGQVNQYNVTVLTVTCLGSGSKVVVDATWWCDGLEIFAGFCGMASAAGFGSQYNDTAAINFQAVPFGNYYPARNLITWTGWVNPVGNQYWEFRGGVVLGADGSCSGNSNATSAAQTPGSPGVGGLFAVGYPAYMQMWQRGQTPSAVTWDASDGFSMQVKSLSPGSM